jgi:stage V sporulation protein SpoVS
VAAVFVEHPAVRVAGAVTAAVGVYTVHTSVKSLGAVRRKFIEEEERALTLQPILIDDGSGRLGPGLQVNWSF